jgi:hypothetical protein
LTQQGIVAAGELGNYRAGMNQRPTKVPLVRAFLAFAFIGIAGACSTTTAAPACEEGRVCPEPQPDAAPLPPTEVPRTERVLFVGNSYTESNDLPRVVEAIGAETQTPFATESILVAGATLYAHWESTGAKEKIANGKFDAVVVQGQSLEALGGESAFDSYAPRFGDQAKDSGSRVVWFATWARGPGSPSQRGEAVANRIEQAYSTVARAKGGKVARVGAAFHQAQIHLPSVPLYQADQSHPTKEGTLLAACTIVHTLTGKVPRVPDPAPLGIAQDIAKALCSVGADVRCLEGGDLCDGTCFKLQSEPQHCGTCSNACASGDPCTAGQCGCAPGLKACGLVCRNLEYDPAHCGACGKQCDSDRYCKSGVCACGGSQVLPVTFLQLAALDPACTEFRAPGCDNAGKQYCLSRGCSATGFGPATGHSPNVDDVMCLSSLSPVQIEYSALKAFEVRCDGLTERQSEGCVSAVHRYCQAQGAVSGFGHHQPSGTQVSVSCLASPRAMALTVDFATLQGHASRCSPHPVTCNAAAWTLCTSLGFRAGFGPVEASGNLRTIVCVSN